MAHTFQGTGPHQHAQSLLTVHKSSTLLPSSAPLRRLLMALDKPHLIHVVLYWIDEALHAPSPSIVPPQLSRRPPRRDTGTADIDDVPGQDTDLDAKGKGGYEDATTTASFLDLYEDRRARSYEELRRLWAQVMPEAKVARTRAVDRIVDVDWPQGISFGMTATVAFEVARANPLGRSWTAMRFDFGESAGKDKTTNGEAMHNQAATRLERLRYMTPTIFADLYSRELRHYCSHAIFIDSPVEEKVPLDLKLNDEDELPPLPQHWAAPFTHIRVVACETPTDVCSIGLHILQIPHSPWCLVSGSLGRRGAEVREMALNALANAVGARFIRMPKQRSAPKDVVVKSGILDELCGRDPLALRQVLISQGLVEDRTQEAGAVPGGKGRSMRRHEAEDGPLTRPEKRQRDDKSGLYADANGRHDDQDDRMAQDIAPKERRSKARQTAAERRARQREVEDLFGQAVNVTGDGDLPRIEKIQYDLYLPFPAENGRELVPKHLTLTHPIALRLEGSHVLAGLRKLVGSGLDAPTSRKVGEKEAEQPALPSHGLPQWLTEVRGTRVRIGAPHADAIDDADHSDDSVEE